MTRKRRAAFTEEFRREAVKRAEKPGNSNASVAKELGVSAQQIYNWRRQFNRLSEKQFNSINGVDLSKPESAETRRLKKENAELKKEIEFLKKGSCVLREPKGVKYALIREHVGQFSIALMCKVLQVSRAGYYRWRDRPKSETELRREKMKEQVADTWATFKARYGAPRIAEELRALNVPCSVNYVAELLRIQGLKARNGKRFTYGGHPLAMNNVSDNLLWREFGASGPNQKWTTDITYIWVEKKWVYLATVMDLFSRTIVGWALDSQMTEQLVMKALQMAFDRREIQPGLIVHSDRGVQYRSQKYVDFMRRNGAKPSMSRKGNCWDNAPMESFFSRLKVELIYAEQFESTQEVKSAVFEYIEVFYNRLRRHSALGYISPAEFERNAALAA